MSTSRVIRADLTSDSILAHQFMPPQYHLNQVTLGEKQQVPSLVVNFNEPNDEDMYSFFDEITEDIMKHKPVSDMFKVVALWYNLTKVKSKALLPHKIMSYGITTQRLTNAIQSFNLASVPTYTDLLEVMYGKVCDCCGKVLSPLELSSKSTLCNKCNQQLERGNYYGN